MFKFPNIPILLSSIVILLMILVLNISQTNAARTDNSWNERLGTYLETAWPEGRNILINGVNKYLNFGIDSGSSGYGIRDNAGTIECKDDGGNWSACQDGNDGGVGSGGGLATSSPWTNGNLAYVTGLGTVGSVATGTLTETVTGVEFNATRGLIGGAAVLSLTSGYEIPLTASTSQWSNALFSNSAQLAALLSDETGTAGSAVFSVSPTLTGTTALANASTTNLSVATDTYLATTTFTGLTTSTAVFVDASKRATSTAPSSFLLTSLTDETGSGVAVFGTSPAITTSITTPSTSFTAWAGATTLLTIGGTGASASLFAPSTLDTTSSITGAIRTSGGISAAKALNIGTTGTFGTQVVSQLLTGSTTALGILSLKSTSGVGTSDSIRLLVGNNGATEAMRASNNGNISMGTTTATSSRLTVQGESSGIILTLLSSAGTKFMEMLNTGVTTLLGTWDFNGATVKQHTYKSFTWPGTATTTAATSTVPLGTAFTAEAWNSAECWVTSGTGAVIFTDGTNNMNGFTSTTTAARTTLSTNNTFTASERRYVTIGPVTAAQLSCTLDVTVNN